MWAINSDAVVHYKATNYQLINLKDNYFFQFKVKTESFIKI